MNHPDLIIQLNADGTVARILSTLPLTYQTVYPTRIEGEYAMNLSDPKEGEVVGRYTQLLHHLGLREPSKDFDPGFVLMLCCDNSFLRKAYEKYGYKADQRAKQEALATEFNGAVLKILRVIYNTFIVADQRMVEQYLKLQK